jgi:hypothetical protein
MAPIFFLIRLPFFFIGLALYIGISTPLAIGFWLLWGVWLVFKLPFQLVGKFFSAAFSNRSSELENWGSEGSQWNDWFSAVGEYFSTYRSLGNWLAHGG